MQFVLDNTVLTNFALVKRIDVVLRAGVADVVPKSDMASMECS